MKSSICPNLCVELNESPVERTKHYEWIKGSCEGFVLQLSFQTGPATNKALLRHSTWLVAHPLLFFYMLLLSNSSSPRSSHVRVKKHGPTVGLASLFLAHRVFPSLFYSRSINQKALFYSESFTSSYWVKCDIQINFK